MMGWLYVHDWSDHQSYREDRGQPPWIKVQRSVMRSHKWVMLTDAERGQLISLWLLAADHQGKIPDNEILVARLCYMTEPLNLQRFIDLGLLDADGDRETAPRQDDASVTPTRRQGDVKVTSTRRQGDAPEEEEEEEEEAEEEEEKEAEAEKRKHSRATRFRVPTLDEVRSYCAERRNTVDPERFIDYYTANGWRVGKNPMRDWKASVRTWEKSGGGGNPQHLTYAQKQAIALEEGRQSAIRMDLEAQGLLPADVISRKTPEELRREEVKAEVERLQAESRRRLGIKVPGG